MKEKRVRRLATRNALIRQVAVLPFRRTAGRGVEIMLLTSRQTARFVIPKGWPMEGLADRKAAAVEAKQEAGLFGTVAKKPIGTYQYWKRLRSVFVRVTVFVFAMEVTKEKPDWLEKGTRLKRWLTGEQAMALVDEPELVTLIERFVRSSAKDGDSDRGGPVG